jgi:hypothetical protein
LQCVAIFGVLPGHVAGEAHEALIHSAQLGVDGGSQGLGASCVVAAKAFEPGPQRVAECLDATHDLCAQCRCRAVRCLSACLCLGGGVRAQLRDIAAQVLIDCGEPRLEPRELRRELGRQGGYAGVFSPLTTPEQQDDGREQSQELQNRKDKRHFDFPSP